MKKIIFSSFFLFLLAFSYAQTQSFSEEAKKAAKEEVQKLHDRVVNGEQMSTIAVLYSQDPGSATKGGLYTNVGKGVMDPNFEKVAFSLKEKEISEVFETVYGYHFIQLEKRHEDLVDIRHVLIIPKDKK